MRNSNSKAGLTAFVLTLVVVSCAAPASPDDSGSRPARGSVVRIEGTTETGYELIRDGRPFVIHGVGGTARLDVLAACGGNTVRTWDAETALATVDGRTLLEQAHDAGITVTVGLWLEHERHGFRYDDAARVAAQRKRVEEAVRRIKDFPALLTWGLGNEMEGPTGRGDREAVWKEVELLARRIHAIDPNHPVMTVVANVNPDKVRAIREHAPSIDILGVNAYAGAAGVGNALRRMGWTKPYCVTEYGLPGPWEVDQTDWRAPIEPTSRRKAGFYNVATTDILADTKQCLGAYAFLWGSKQEATASWFGMLLPSGEKTIAADAMAEAWTGSWPNNRAPILGDTRVPLANRRVKTATTFDVLAPYHDPEGDALRYYWEVRRESTDRREGGDAERVPEEVPKCIVRADDSGNATIRVPSAPGAYRLFVTVRDGKGSGCIDNWPFFVEL